MYRHFEEIADAVKTLTRRRLAVAGAADEQVLKSVLRAKRESIAEPILVGDKESITRLLDKMNEAGDVCQIVSATHGEEARCAVELVREGSADILMKGLIETREILKAVVDKSSGLHNGSIMSHVGFFDRVPHMNKFIVQTDGGMVLYPTLEEKKAIIENAVSVLHAIGNKCPSVAVLSATEKVNASMTESVDADALKRMNRNGSLTGCIVEGPISYDVAMDAEIARMKEYESPYCGKFDMLVVPTISAGNFIGKCWTVTCGALLGGIVAGAKAPIVLTSRGSSADEKFYSIAIAALTIHDGCQ